MGSFLYFFEEKECILRVREFGQGRLGEEDEFRLFKGPTTPANLSMRGTLDRLVSSLLGLLSGAINSGDRKRRVRFVLGDLY